MFLSFLFRCLSAKHEGGSDLGAADEAVLPFLPGVHDGNHLQLPGQGESGGAPAHCLRLHDDGPRGDPTLERDCTTKEGVNGNYIK